MVIIVDHDEIPKLQMASSAGSFTGNTLHSATISKECEGMVVDELEAWFVELGSCMCLGNCKTNGVCKTLTEGSSSNFDTGCILSFGVTRCDAIYCLDQESNQLQQGNAYAVRADRHTRKAFRSSNDTL